MSDTDNTWRDDPRFAQLKEQIQEIWERKGASSLYAVLTSGIVKRFPQGMIVEAVKALREEQQKATLPSKEQMISVAKTGAEVASAAATVYSAYRTIRPRRR